MHAAIDLEHECQEQATNHEVHHGVALSETRLTGILHRDEFIRHLTHLALSKIEFVEEVFDLRQHKVDLGAILCLHDGFVLEHVTRLVLGDGDHLDDVLAEILIHEVHVRDLSGARPIRQVVVEQPAQQQHNHPVLKVGLPIRLEVEALQSVERASLRGLGLLLASSLLGVLVFAYLLLLLLLFFLFLILFLLLEEFLEALWRLFWFLVL